MELKVRTFWYFTKEAATSLFRNGLMTVTAVITITLALLILGNFYICIINVNHFTEMAKAVLEIRIYLDDNVDAVALQNKMLGFDGVKGVKFVSKTEGANWLGKSLGMKDLKNFMEEDNPLPDMINIKLKDDVHLKTLTAQLEALPGVTEVEYGQDFIKSMLLVIQIIWVVGVSLLIIVGLVVLYIIINTIRLTVFARLKEIEIMKLVGATDWFIRWPFMFEGVILGLSGALLADILISKGYHILFRYIKQLAPFIPLMGERLINGGLFGMISLVGLAFGTIGSIMSIKKFLKV
jgi:cell division transport system permease protein